MVAVGAPAGHDGESVTGDVMTLAARLQTMAPAGGVLADEATRRATEALFVWREADPTAGPLEGRELRAWTPVSARGHFGIDVRPRSSTPFVGRAEELGMLRGAYRRAIRESSVQLVTIIGEPGAGKSRLIGEFFRFIDDLPELVRWRQGRCLPYGEGVSFWALGEIVKADADILESDPEEEARRKLAEAAGAALEDEAERDCLTSRLAPLVGIEAETVDREESFTAWRRFLEGLATRSPLVLVFEDLHWADAPMLEFLDHLLEWFTGPPLLVICAARPEVFERHPGWGGGKRNSTTISLPALSQAETAMLISALLDRRILPAETHAAILERAGGNPLYAEEFARRPSASWSASPRAPSWRAPTAAWRASSSSPAATRIPRSTPARRSILRARRASTARSSGRSNFGGRPASSSATRTGSRICARRFASVWSSASARRRRSRTATWPSTSGCGTDRRRRSSCGSAASTSRARVASRSRRGTRRRGSSRSSTTSATGTGAFPSRGT